MTILSMTLTRRRPGPLPPGLTPGRTVQRRTGHRRPVLRVVAR
jgi:hypothetical protein